LSDKGLALNLLQHDELLVWVDGYDIEPLSKGKRAKKKGMLHPLPQSGVYSSFYRLHQGDRAGTKIGTALKGRYRGDHQQGK
jgi:hypothetical protein